MPRLLKKTTVAVVIVVVAAQFVRPSRTNPSTDTSRTRRAHFGSANGLVAVVDRVCRDCHSNETVWPTSWYERVAPVSWVIASGVSQGRRGLTFSEWTTYSPAVQQTLLAA